MEDNRDSQKDNFTNPFPGLRPFRFGESHLFFGREHQVSQVIEQLLDKNFMAIIGASGVGKSSFMTCGVLSSLLKDTAYGDKWEVFVTTPGNDPVVNLAKSLLNGLSPENADDIHEEAEGTAKPEDIEALATTLKETPKSLTNLVNERNASNDKKFLLFIDQFEEVFRYRSDKQAQESVEHIIDIITTTLEEENDIYIVLSVRSDFIGDCARFPLLTSAINKSQYLIPQLTREEKQRAIEGPVEYMGATIAPDLVETVLNDVGESSDQLPIMQHALMRTWDYWQNYRSIQDPITLAEYNGVGGMKNALSEHAREAFRELNTDEKVICERIFKAITEKGEEGRGVRRPTALKEITQIVDADKDKVVRVIDYFRSPGRSLLLPSSQVKLEDNSMIDISHESLMRNWVELVEWVDEEAESVKLYRRLAEAAGMHQEGKAGLWRPPDLLLAQNWRREQKPTKAWGLRYHKAFERTLLFLEHSEKEYERTQRIKEKMQKRRIAIFRRIAAVMFVLSLVAGWFWITANEQRNAAMVATELAKEEGERAKQQKLIAEENEQRALVQESIATQQKEAARYNAILALQQKKLAEEERIRALSQESIASFNAKIAFMNEKEATGLRLLSTAKSMAIKSLQIDNAQLKGLVAKQAYNFNKEQNGKSNDPDIYDGLYYALKSLKDANHFNLDDHDQNVRSMVTSRLKPVIYSTGSDGKIIKWNSASEVPTATVLDQPKELKINKSLALNYNETKLACGGDFKYIEIFNLNSSGQEPEVIPTEWKETWYLAFTNSGDLLTVGSNNRIMIYKNGAFSPISDGEHKINAIAFNTHDNSLIAAQNNGELVRYRLSTGTSEVLLQNTSALFSVAVSENGAYIATGDEKGNVIVYQNNTGRRVFLAGHTARVNYIAFNHSNTTLATGSFDKTVRLWSTKAWDDAPVVLRDHKDWVWSIIFNHDDSRLWAGSRDYLIRVWPTELDEMSAQICKNLSRSRLSSEEWKQVAGDDFAEADTIITCTNNISLNHE